MHHGLPNGNDAGTKNQNNCAPMTSNVMLRKTAMNQGMHNVYYSQVNIELAPDDPYVMLTMRMLVSAFPGTFEKLRAKALLRAPHCLLLS